MAVIFKKAVDRIATKYHCDASLIWKGEPQSSVVIQRFLEFDGCGVKIATMATNLLHRCLGVDYADYSAIDVSPDVHVLRVMNRLGLISRENRDLAIYAARGLNPDYPGILDGYFWRIGKDFCNPGAPKCEACSLHDICNNSPVDL